LRKCLWFEDIHLRAARYFQRWTYAITIPWILVNSGMAVLSRQEGTDTDISYLVSGVFAANTVLSSLREFFKFDRRSQFHAQQAEGYGHLAHTIQASMALELDTQTVIYLTQQFRILCQHTDFIIPSSLVIRMDPAQQWLVELEETYSTRVAADVPTTIQEFSVSATTAPHAELQIRVEQPATTET
jgi:hypothetical protein